MNEQQHATYREWLDQHLDAGLPPDLEGRLAEHLEQCSECRREREQLAHLAQLLLADRLPVRAGFVDRVIERATVGETERRQAGPTLKRPWLVAIAAILLFGASGALLLAPGSLPAISLATTMGDFLGTTLLAGAGLLAASWRGVGMVVEGWLSASLPNLLVSLFLIVSLNLLLLRLVRRRAAPEQVSRRRD